MSDEEFSEFHLDGKHLAFLVISGIGVAVVVFLCGVLVGRGVRAPRSASATDIAAVAIDDLPIGSEPSLDDRPATDAGRRLSEKAPPRSDRSGAPAVDSIPTPEPEPVTPAPASPPVPRAGSPASAAPAVKQAAPVTPPHDASGGKWVVQVASGASRASAESLAGKLKSKGYDAFISEYPQGGSQYRVRVGTFGKESDARAAAARLKKEGKFKDVWVTH